MKASVVDLRRRMKDVVRALERGETVELTHRGKTKGVVHPSKSACMLKRACEHEAFGIWSDRDDLDDVATAVRRLRKGRGHVV